MILILKQRKVQHMLNDQVTCQSCSTTNANASHSLRLKSAGVGLSYSDKEGSEDYFTDDDVTAADAETFLRK